MCCQILHDVQKVLSELTLLPQSFGRYYQMFTKFWKISTNVHHMLTDPTKGPSAKCWQILPNVHKVQADLTKCTQCTGRYYQTSTKYLQISRNDHHMLTDLTKGLGGARKSYPTSTKNLMFSTNVYKLLVNLNTCLQYANIYH